jgi:hypothetical protein
MAPMLAVRGTDADGARDRRRLQLMPMSTARAADADCALLPTSTARAADADCALLPTSTARAADANCALAPTPTALAPMPTAPADADCPWRCRLSLALA